MATRSSNTKNRGWALGMEEVVEWFNYPRASVHPRCEVSCQGVSTWIVALPVLRQGQPNGEESCILLESGSTRRPVAKVL